MLMATTGVLINNLVREQLMEAPVTAQRKNMAQKDLHEDRVERMKLLYDLTKHITTLSTGTLLLMAGLLEKIFKAPVWKPLATGAFLSFAASVVASLIAMLGFAMYSRATFRTSDDPVKMGLNVFPVALALFIFGVSLFTIFVCKNF